jgi:hypothetical protein
MNAVQCFPPAEAWDNVPDPSHIHRVLIEEGVMGLNATCARTPLYR